MSRRKFSLGSILFDCFLLMLIFSVLTTVIVKAAVGIAFFIVIYWMVALFVNSL